MAPRRSRPGGFPIVTHEPTFPEPVAAAVDIVGVRPEILLRDDRPGRYRILGVVAATGTDTKMYIEAESLANARVKAELRGVIVTDIVKQ